MTDASTISGSGSSIERDWLPIVFATVAGGLLETATSDPNVGAGEGAATTWNAKRRVAIPEANGKKDRFIKQLTEN